MSIFKTKHKYGTPGNDWLAGSADDEIFHHSAGNDFYSGAGGYDVLSYANSDSGVTVYGTAGEAGGTVAFQGSTEKDTFTGIEKVIGSAHGDVFWAADIDIDGGAGDDWILSGAGANRLDGGSGVDTVSYAYSTEAVDVQLQYYQMGHAYFARAQGGYAEGDTLIGIENLNGSAFDDILGGDGKANRLEGNGGNDQLWGHGGDDSLLGEKGHDWLYGGAGNDTLDGDTGDDELHGGDGRDNLNGGAGNDLLDGGEGNDYLWGAAGADTAFGGSGQDLLDGDFGDDELVGGSGDDMLIGGEGADVLQGDSGADHFTFFKFWHSSASAPDRIVDFSRAEGDKIDLSSIDHDHNLSSGLLYTPYPEVSSAFAKGTVAVSHIFNDTYVQINIHENPGADGLDHPEMVIVLDGWHDLTADDFIFAS